MTERSSKRAHGWVSHATPTICPTPRQRGAPGRRPTGTAPRHTAKTYVLLVHCHVRVGRPRPHVDALGVSAARHVRRAEGIPRQPRLAHPPNRQRFVGTRAPLRPEHKRKAIVPLARQVRQRLPGRPGGGREGGRVVPLPDAPRLGRGRVGGEVVGNVAVDEAVAFEADVGLLFTVVLERRVAKPGGDRLELGGRPVVVPIVAAVGEGNTAMGNQGRRASGTGGQAVAASETDRTEPTAHSRSGGYKRREEQRRRCTRGACPKRTTSKWDPVVAGRSRQRADSQQLPVHAASRSPRVSLPHGRHQHRG